MMSKKRGTVEPLPPCTITTPARQRRFTAIRDAVDRFAAEVELTPLQRHLLGLIIDEAIETVSPRASYVAVAEASNDEV